MALTRRILLVEPDPQARQSFVRTLDGQGLDIDVAADLPAALQSAERTPYAVFVVEDALRRCRRLVRPAPAW